MNNTSRNGPQGKIQTRQEFRGWWGLETTRPHWTKRHWRKCFDTRLAFITNDKETHPHDEHDRDNQTGHTLCCSSSIQHQSNLSLSSKKSKLISLQHRPAIKTIIILVTNETLYNETFLPHFGVYALVCSFTPPQPFIHHNITLQQTLIVNILICCKRSMLNPSTLAADTVEVNTRWVCYYKSELLHSHAKEEICLFFF